jgi:hypothetical protein
LARQSSISFLPGSGLQTLLSRLLIFILLSLPAFATSAVSGKLVTPNNIGVSDSSAARFDLVGCNGNYPILGGQSMQSRQEFALASDGTWSGNLARTDEVSCNGQTSVTTWNFSYFVNGLRVGPTRNLTVNATNCTVSCVVDSITPNAITPVAPAPTTDSTYARLDGGNQPYTGANWRPSVNNTQDLGTSLLQWRDGWFGRSLAAAKIESTRYADQWASADAAASDCSTNPCFVMIPPNYSGSEPSSFPVNVIFVDQRSQTAVAGSKANVPNLTGSGAVQTYGGNASFRGLFAYGYGSPVVVQNGFATSIQSSNTNSQVSGLGSAVQNNSSTPVGVSFWGHCNTNVNSGKCFGANYVVTAESNKTNLQLTGIEVDLQPSATGTTFTAANGVTAYAYGRTLGNAFLVGTGDGGIGTWPVGYGLGQGAITSTGTGILFGGSSTMAIGIDLASTNTYTTAAISVPNSNKVAFKAGAGNDATISNSGSNILTLVGGNSGTSFTNNANNVNIVNWDNAGQVKFGVGLSNNSAGLKHARVAGCTTAAGAAGTCQVTVTWGTAFADTSYTPVCTADAANISVTTTNIAAASVKVNAYNVDTSAHTVNNVYCIAIHD